MAKELLTAHSVRAITKAGVYKDGGGLRLIVTARGTKRWELWISINGRRREQGLGVYPTVSLKERATKRTRSGGRLAMASICVQQRAGDEARALHFAKKLSRLLRRETQAALQCETPQAMAEHDGERMCFPSSVTCRSQTSRLIRSSKL